MRPKQEASCSLRGDEDIVCSCRKLQAGTLAYRVDLTTQLDNKKGVIVKIEKAENMPVDAAGNRADIVLDPASTISRMNIGRLYTHYISGACRDVNKHLRALLGIREVKWSVDKLADAGESLISQAYEYLLTFYQCVSPTQYTFFSELNEEERLEHLSEVTQDKINALQLFIPIENPLSSVEMVKAIEAFVKPTYGPVSYVGNSGRRSTTLANVRIAPMYIMMLDKIADEWSSVSTGRLQNFGILSPTIKSEKFTFPFRNTPIRAYGESEFRLMFYSSVKLIAELIDRNNNPQTQRAIYAALLNAVKPTDIDCLVDRVEHPYGNAKNLQVVKHPLMAAGIKLVFKQEVGYGTPRT